MPRRIGARGGEAGVSQGAGKRTPQGANQEVHQEALQGARQEMRRWAGREANQGANQGAGRGTGEGAGAAVNQGTGAAANQEAGQGANQEAGGSAGEGANQEAGQGAGGGAGEGANQEADEAAGEAARSALVVFSGRAELWWLKLLRPGFRHCLLAVNDGRYWILYEPLSNRTEITVLDVPPWGDLEACFRCHGLTVVRTQVRAALPRAAPWMAYTCVEAVKRVLGIRARRIVTPWHLYRHLIMAQRPGGST